MWGENWNNYRIIYREYKKSQKLKLLKKLFAKIICEDKNHKIIVLYIVIAENDHDNNK